MDLSKLDLLKEGSFAKIYVKGEVAYKTGELSSKELLREQFELLSEIKNPHFVSVYEWFEDDGKCGFSMEKINFPTIDQIFKKIPSKKTDFKKLQSIIISLLDSLSVLHSNGIICGDLKPTHIFVDNKNNVKLIDPGYDPDIITPAYAAPEALTDSPTFSSDIYSIGIILYEIFTGEKPFKGSLSTIIEYKLKKGLAPPKEKNPSIPEELNLLILRMTAKDPNNRFKSIEEVKRELALGAPTAEKKPSFMPVFSGRENELKEFDSAIKNLPDPHIFRIEGERGIGKTALLNQFKIKALTAALSVKEVTQGELYRLLSEKNLTGEPIVLLLDNITSSEITGTLKEHSASIRTNPIIIAISLIDKTSQIEELSDITTTFTLSPLEKKDIEFILDKNFPQFENKEELISFLTERTKGNPSLLNRTIEILIEEGAIERKGEKIIFKQKKASSVSLPESIQENIKFQMENIPLEERELLKILSVFPEKIPLDLISLFKVKNPHTLINSLASKNILQKDKKGIHFKNNWVREFLYKNLAFKDKENIYDQIKEEIPSPETLYLLQKDLKLKKEYRKSLIKIAKKRIKEKEYAEAIKFLKEALEIKDDKINKMVLARVLEMSGNINEALLLYNKLLSEYKENSFYLLKIGSLEERIGNKEEAEEFFRKVLKASKGKIKEKAIYSLGYLLIRKGETEEISNIISDFKKTEGKLPLRLKFIEGRVLCMLGKFGKTLEIVEEALSKDLSPEMKRDFLILGGITKQQNEEHKEAIQYIQESIDIAKDKKDVINEATFMTGKGVSLLNLDKYREAQEEMEEAFLLFKKLKIRNSEYYCLLNLSFIYLKMGYWDKLKERIEDFKNRYGKINPKLKEILLSSFLFMGKWDKVEKIQNELRKENHELKYTEGVSFSFKEEWQKAEEVLKKFIKDSKGDPKEERDITCELSEVLFEQGRKEEAISILKPHKEKIKSIQSDFEKGKLHSSWGLIASDIKSINRAIQLFSKIGLSFYVAQTRLKKAKVLIEENKIEEAIEELKKCEEIFKELKSGLFLEKTNELFAECAKKISLRSGYIHTYDEISKLLSSIDSEKRFDEALSVLTNFFKAERGAIILKEEEKNIIVSSYNIDEATLDDARRISSTITQKAAKGEVIIAGDAFQDSRFLEMDSIRRNKIRSILCVPVTSEEEIYGVLYMDSTIKKDIFLPSDKEFLQSIGRILGVLFSKGDLLYRMREEVKQLKRMTSPPESFYSIIGISEQMQKIYKTIEEIAETDVNVLITGETGTGKELIARTIHKLSKRNNRPFVTVDCSSLTETLLQSELFGHKKGSFTGAIKDKKGMFEEANGGTLFLDEIGDAPASIQAGLLRVTDRGEIRRVGETESKKVDVRIISATNRDIEQAAMLREFREDLLFRLNQINISIPPLRERKIDISLLLKHYLKIFSENKEKAIKGFDENAMRFLRNYPFPGNIRELKNIVEISLIRCKGEYISHKDLPEEIRKEKKAETPSWDKIKTKWKKETIIEALQESGGNVSEAAKTLKISRRHLYRLIKEHDMKR
ncbi:sigma 54-interacting transcriptional regulator [candidate division WOR-3 bacterium]|nr:sigma 54-interacting transcriptional regulator [candidate division WOR-3 bacterium]